MYKRMSWSRVILLSVMLGAVAYLASTGYAQDTTPAAAGAQPEQQNIVGILARLIFERIDFVTVIIAVLSIAAFTLIINSALRLRGSAFMPEATIAQIRTMIENRQFKELIDYTEVDNSFVARSLNPALKRAPNFLAMKEAMETAIGEQSAEQFRKIEYLNIIGNLGPLLGLLGTVLGMVQAFDVMERLGAEPKFLAGGVARALTHTFLGLFLAVPSLAAFGILRTAVDRLTVRAALVCEELLLMIKPPEQRTTPPAGPQRPVGVTPPPAQRPRVNPIVPPPSAPTPQ